MKPARMYIPASISEVRDLLASMLGSAPKFKDKTGYMPFLNLDYRFSQLHASFNHNKASIGEEHYEDLMRMSEEIRALFEADPDDKTGETVKGCKIIHHMDDILAAIENNN